MYGMTAVSARQIRQACEAQTHVGEAGGREEHVAGKGLLALLKAYNLVVPVLLLVCSGGRQGKREGHQWKNHTGSQPPLCTPLP